MKQLIVVFTLTLSGLVTGCGTVNSNVSCKAEATDSCLTIEQVDAMTRFADDAKPSRQQRGAMNADNNRQNLTGQLIKQNTGQSIWVAKQVEGQSWA
ncbi:conjugal transfer protein TraV [Legionella massiliensis]|uniref:Conjugal transfer protein TraV n=1 Tax=Legionella massiliensis TaxID=1034943 RepID=A0A078L652_9GAMM|nr:conjugal transfer protein [Legionella massiliensis]CDZ79403.1 conjugal transfer protein TraV [Legionella massiliensis]CEE15141.1 hypothetical protein BN1094_03721 [Legionella massiliensis]